MLAIWINDLHAGILNVRDAVLSAVWKSFHEGGIEFPFPQRDLHIEDAAALRMVREAPSF